jgi:hypothetical protein
MKRQRRGVHVMAAVFAALAMVVFAFSALATAPGTPIPIAWGVVADAGTFALLDSGVQTSIPFPNPQGTDGIICTNQDAGTNNASGAVTLLGSNTAAANSWVVVGSATLMPGVSGAVGWTGVLAGTAYYAVQVDAGGAVAGSVQCTLSSQGSQP